MCDPVTAAAAVSTGGQAFGAVSSVFGAYSKSKATKKAYEYDAAVDRNNAQYAEFNAEDAITRGQIDEGNSRLKYASVKGSQRARFAANGVDVDYGSARNIQDDTQMMSDLDAATIKDNALRAAWGFKVQAQGYTDNARLLKSRADAESPGMAALTQLMGSGATVADSWYRRNAPNPYAK